MCEHARGTLMSVPDDVGSVPHLHHPAHVSLRRLFGELQRVVDVNAERTPSYITSVSTLLQRVRLSDEEWQQFANWNATKYTRSLIAHDPNFTVLLLCWNRGQTSPIHDHAGSCCWVKVLNGTLRENRYRQHADSGELEKFQTSDLPANGVTYIDDTRGLHDMGGSDKEERCVSLHVYSPPYYYCNAFGLDGSKRQVSLLAATAPRREAFPSSLAVRLLRHPHHHALVNKESSSPVLPNSSVGAVPTQPSPQPSSSAISIRELVDCLDSGAAKETVVKAFEQCCMSQEDWSYMAHFNESRYQRLLLHENSRFSLLMLCWLPNQRTPVHDHMGSESWVKVLEGELAICTFKLHGGEVFPTGEMKSLTAETTAVPFHEDAALPLHAVGNEGKGFAISLHLYHPPYTEMCYHSFVDSANDPNGGAVVSADSAGDSSDGESVKSFTSNSSRSSRKVSIPCVSCHRPCRVSKLDSLTPILDRIFCAPCDLDRAEEIIEQLASFPLDPKEITRFWEERNRLGGSVRLAETPAYNIILNLWEPGACTVVHDHDGSTAFLLVARGKLSDTTYLPPTAPGEKPKVYRSCKIKAGEVCYYTADALHSLRNPAASDWAATIHVYHRKCAAATWYSLRVDAKPMRVAVGVGGTTVLQADSQATTPVSGGLEPESSSPLSPSAPPNGEGHFPNATA